VCAGEKQNVMNHQKFYDDSIDDFFIAGERKDFCFAES
jgi:hypothetical protein